MTQREGQRGRAAINFKHIADVCLSRAESLAAAWLPDGKREGPEWSARNPSRNDHKAGSFKINLVSGRWSDFASGEAGGDFVSLYAYLHGLDQPAAARDVAAQVGIAFDAPAGTAAPPNAAKPKKSDAWESVQPVPANASPAPVAHVVRGAPTAVWIYRDLAGEVLGYIHRYTNSTGGKEIVPLTLWRHADTHELKWRWAQFPELRPLYGLDRLAGREALPVLIVEGEKCADAAHAAIGDRVAVLSWPGGGKAASKAAWTVLAGRNIVLWADCDAQTASATQAKRLGIAEGALLPDSEQPGVCTMRQIGEMLAKQGCRVRNVQIPAAGSVASGWDVADALADGWDAARVWDSLKNSRASAGAGGRAPPPEYIPMDQRDDADAWRDRLQWTDGRNARLLDCRENVYLHFLHHPQLKGLVAFDSFAQRVVLTRVPPWSHSGGNEWTDYMDTQAGYWFSQLPECLRIRNAATLGEGVQMAARENEVHPVRDYLRPLKWDGIPRIDHWLVDHMGAQDSAYARACGRKSIIAMIARVMQPGCHSRAVLVLLGPQNIGKSKAIRALATPWSADTPFRVGDKDTFQMIAGVWVYEISELDSFSRSDQNSVKAFISSPEDRFRPPYARRMQTVPRQTVFMASANKLSFIQDATGGTRYWPVGVTNVNLQAIVDNRDQMIAEAKVAYEAGENWWPEDEALLAEFTAHQEAHMLPNVWTPIINNWLEDTNGKHWPMWREKDGRMRQWVDMTMVLIYGIGTETAKIGAMKNEVALIEQSLIDLGFEKTRATKMVGGKRPYVYVRWREMDAEVQVENEPI